VDAGGVRLHALEYGEGAATTVVIVPGITSPAATWEFVSEELARDHHVVCLDVRGRGYSDTPESGYTLEDYAADVAALIDGLGLDRPVVLGHSMGARVAVAFGALYPELRGPLLVVDPPLTGPGRPPYATPLEAFVTELRAAKSGAAAELTRRNFPSWTDQHLALRAAWLPTCDERAVTETYRLFDHEDFFAHWRLLRPPVQFVWGSESPAVTEAGAREVAEANPDAAVTAVPRAGHMVPWDNLPGFLEVARRFLAEV
jgi:N-formylmaleamate deformylase